MKRNLEEWMMEKKKKEVEVKNWGGPMGIVPLYHLVVRHGHTHR
jgi:hypothetical protein